MGEMLLNDEKSFIKVCPAVWNYMHPGKYPDFIFILAGCSSNKQGKIDK